MAIGGDVSSMPMSWWSEIFHANGLPVTRWKQDLLKRWYTDTRRQKFAQKHLDALKRVVDLLIRWHAGMIEKHFTYSSISAALTKE